MEETFADGRSHYAEESGYNKDGLNTHWLVNTTPIMDFRRPDHRGHGNVPRYHRPGKGWKMNLKNQKENITPSSANIPNPVFVLDIDTLEILDCNQSVESVYGFKKDEISSIKFMDLFKEDKEQSASRLRTARNLDRIKHISKDGRTIFVNIRVSPSEYSGQSVLLVTTSDITKRLEAEQQLAQASKLATLGEMATGVAHELNQPLSVIKTVSSFFIKKIKKQEKIR